MTTQRKTSTVFFKAFMIALLILLPLLYGVLISFLQLGYKQIELSDAGRILIPAEWNYEVGGEEGVDAVIYDKDGRVVFTGYQGDQSRLPETSQEVVRGSRSFAGEGWAIFEDYDPVTGTRQRYFEIILSHGSGYVLLSTSDLVNTATFLRIASSSS